MVAHTFLLALLDLFSSVLLSLTLGFNGALDLSSSLKRDTKKDKNMQN